MYTSSYTSLKKILNYYSLFLFCILFSSQLQSQYIENQLSVDFESITTENGLSQNTVHKILKDKSGYIWFGTEEGLNRYNSYDIEVIADTSEKSDILSGKKIFDLFEDKGGHLWIGTDNGLKLYDPISETIKKQPLFDNLNKNISINCIEKENDSQIWLGTSEGLVLYDLQNGVIESHKHTAIHSNSLSNSNVLSLGNDSNGIWVGTSNGLNFFDKKTKKITNSFKEIKNSTAITETDISKILKDKKGNLWIGTLQNGIVYYSKENNEFYTYNTKNSGLPHNEVRDIFETKEGNLCIATNGGGLSKMNTKERSFTNFQHDPNHIEGLTTNALYTVYEDKEGILWVGTYTGGVCFNTSKNDTFKLIKHQAHNSNSISQSRIRSLLLDSNENLWFGTLQGLNLYNPRTKKYASFLHDENDPSSLSFNTVTSIFEDHKKNIWVGTYSGGLNLFNSKKTKFTHYKTNPNDKNSLSSDKVYCLSEDLNKNLWIGTKSGLNLFNRAKNNFKKFSDRDIRDIKIMKNNHLVLAIDGGISFFNPSTENFEDFYTKELASFPLNQVVLDKENDLIWFCSQGAGMGFFNPKNRTFKFFTEKDGLPSNFVSSIVEHKKNTLWISTFKGLSKFNKTTQKFENFGTIHKLPSYQFQPKAFICLPDNTIGFGGNKGLVIFQPDSIGKSVRNPIIEFSSLKIDNKIANVNVENSPLTKSISKTKTLHLKARQNDFTIDFAALDFNNPKGNQYTYILENYMDDWNFIGSSRSIGFTNLNHGEYVLKIKTANNISDGNETSLKIIIAPPFYATWWFKSIIIILLFILFFLYNKYTLISIKQRNNLKLQKLKLKNEEDFSDMRFRFFTYISHELRTPLTLISDPLHQLIKNKNNTTDIPLLNLIDKSVSRLLRLVDQILDISKLEGDTLNLQISQQDIVNCIEETTSAFYEFAIQQEVNFTCEKKMNILEGWIDDDKIEKIMYNLLSNAFKFTPKNGNITISLDYKDETKEYITIAVKDDGIGIDEYKLSRIFDGFYQVKSAKAFNPDGAGIGLDYVKRLVNLHRGTIEVESEIGVGTTFMVTIPIRKKHYKPEDIKPFEVQKIVSSEFTTSKIPAQKVEKIEELQLPEVKHPKNTPRVLVVEDDIDIRKYIVSSISDKFRVIDAPNGEEGLAKAIEFVPDLILSDTLMPIMDGIEFCKRVKENEKISHIPFLFLSAWTTDNFKIKGLELGAIDYIRKPFSVHILKARIENIIENGKKISEKSKSKVNFVPENKNIDSFDDIFTRKVYDILDANFSNPDFNAHSFKNEMNMSHSSLYRKLKQLTGKSSNEFIRSYRLERAAQIIKQNSGLLISEICIQIGFNDSKYFTKCFKQEFKMTPSEYAKKSNEQLEGEEINDEELES